MEVFQLNCFSCCIRLVSVTTGRGFRLLQCNVFCFCPEAVSITVAYGYLPIRHGARFAFAAVVVLSFAD